MLNIVDATALERNLFLTLQLLEQNLPTVVAVNLCDQLAKNGGRVDCKVLSQRLGVPVIPISARSGENIGKLVKALEKAEKRPGVGPALFALNADQSQEDRYEMIRLLLDGVYDSGAAVDRLTERLDNILTNRYLAIPIFLLVMLLMFTVIFGPPGMAMKAAAEHGAQAVSLWLQALLDRAGASWWAKEMVVDGIWAGVGGMLTFLPQMALLFLFLSLLEDSGYMARGAFVMDGLFSKGRAFRKGVYPPGDGLWLHHSRCNGRTHIGTGRGTPADSTDAAFLLLPGPSCRFIFFLQRLFSRKARAF